MSQKILAIIVLCIGAALVVTTPAHATDVVVTLTPNSSLNFDGSYDSLNGYDYATNATSPPTSYQNIGTFNFTMPPGTNAASVTISGSFGDIDSPTTALSDYYLGFAGDGEAVEVAACDSVSLSCASGDGPTTWSVTLTQTEIAILASAFSAGSIDFGYTWDGSPPAISLGSGPAYDQYVYAGSPTLDIAPTPELGTGLLWCTGLVGLGAFWCFRKFLASTSVA